MNRRAPAAGKRLLPVTFDAAGRMTVHTDDSHLRCVIERASRDSAYFAQTFLSPSFYEEFGEQRKKMCSLFDDDTLPYVAICSWRGIGKSTILSAVYCQRLLFRRSRFPLYITSGFDIASEFTEGVKAELLTNDVIRDVFGFMKQGALSHEDMKYGFNKKGFYLVDPMTDLPFAFVAPKGAGQRVRGLNVRLNGVRIRPDFVTPDDLESDEDCENEDTLKKIRKWYNSALKQVVSKQRPETHGEFKDRWRPRVSPWRPPYRMAVSDTLKDDACLIGSLLDAPEYVSLVLPKARQDDDGEWRSNVIELFSDSDIRREIEIEQSNGTFGDYCREMLCRASDPADREWTTDSFQYYRESEWDVQNGRDWYRYCVTDPARSLGGRSAYTAALWFAVNPVLGRIVVRNEFCARVKPEVIEETLFKTGEELNTWDWAIEKTGLDEWLRSWLDNGIGKRGEYRVRCIPLNSGVGGTLASDYGTGRTAVKKARLSMIKPFMAASPAFSQGHIWFEESMRPRGERLESSAGGGKLIDHLCRYPDLKFWDLADCFGHIPRIMANDGLVFQAQIVDETEKRKRSQQNSRLSSAMRAGLWRVA